MSIQNRFPFPFFYLLYLSPTLAAPGWNPLDMGLNGAVNVVVVHGSDVYVGGAFTDAGGVADADYLARWDGSSWHAVAAGLSAQVRSIAISGSNIYVGGNFIDAGGVGAADRIARWDGSTWNALGNGVPGAVRTIAISGNNVYVGGDFPNVNGNTAMKYVARWDGSAWNALGSGLGAMGNFVYSLVVKGPDLYLGGLFQNAGGNTDADRVARWNGSAWSALGTGTAIANGTVQALAVAGNDLYVGGSFTDAAGNTNADRIARFDGTNWHALGSGIANAVSTVYCIAYDGAELFVGGNIFDAGGNTAADFIAKWTGSAWEGLGSSLLGAVRTIGIAPDNLYVGGDFINGANNGDIDNIARYEYMSLPVELSGFDASLHPEGVWLRWQTESESANDYFQIEHGTDGMPFSPIGRQEGAGNSVQSQRYSFLHRDPLPGQNYYRLRQVDFDGTEHFSPVRGIAIAGAALLAAPNPTAGAFVLRGLGESPARVRLYGATGALLWEGDAADGETVELAAYPSGMYWVEVRQGGGWKTLRVVKR